MHSTLAAHSARSSIMARARLRTYIHSPTDSDPDDLPLHVDEEGLYTPLFSAYKLISATEQEALIASLRSQDASTNALYSTLFAILFLLPAAHALFLLSSSSPTPLLTFLSFSSFLMTSYTTKFIPMSSPEVGAANSHRSLMGHSMPVSDTKGPIDRFFPILNGILAAVVTIGAFVNNSEVSSREILESLVGYFPLSISSACLYLVQMISSLPSGVHSGIHPFNDSTIRNDTIGSERVGEDEI